MAGSRTLRRSAVVEALLALHGRTLADELGIPVSRGTPSALFRLLCAALLVSARIRSEAAIAAAHALAEQGWTTPRALLDAGWEARTRVLNRSGYARYDESTSRMLGDTCELLLSRYGGDLRRLREAAGRDPEQERPLLKECKGIGEVGADVFCREVQLAWPELYPFVDSRAREAAERLGLPSDASALARLVERERFPRLVAALARAARNERELERVRRRAAGAGE